MTATGRRDPASESVSSERGRGEGTEFLLESLRDLERERAAGDLDDDDYQALRDDYTLRAAAALRAEQRGQATPAPPARRRPARQRLVVLAAIVGFAVLTGVLVAQAVGRREDGQGITGEVTATPTQEAGRCLELTTAQELVEAVGCYEAVLEDAPDNAVARTYLGWTLYLTARTASDDLPPEARAEVYVAARRQLDRAVEADPGYADARAFQVVLAQQEGRTDEARRQLAAFDRLDAPADIKALLEPLRAEITG